MTDLDAPRPPIEATTLASRRSRLLWTATAVAIVALLLLCAALIIAAATRG